MVAAPIMALPANASTDGIGVVINEAYLNGGSTGATFHNKFVELYNPTDAAISLSGMSLQYRSASGTGAPSGVQALTGSIPAKGYYLIQGGSNADNGLPLPEPDATISNSFLAGSGGTVFLADQTGAITPPVGTAIGVDGIVDLLGYGTSNTFETAKSSAASITRSLNRNGFADTDNNAADFTTAAPTPTNSGLESEPAPDPVESAGEHTIAEIQGTTDTSPFKDNSVVTKGIVTAAYPDGGFSGYYIQTPGTGGNLDLGTHPASDGIFVFSSATAGDVAIGDYVEVTATVTEFYGMTELNVASGGLKKLDAAAVTAPAPAAVGLPADVAQRESLEGMLVAPQGDFTVTDNYATNQYGEIGLAADDNPLIQPTVLAHVGTPEYAEAVATNKALAVTLDDGSSLNFNSSANQSIPVPYLSTTAPVRIGAAVDFTSPVIFDYRNDTWKYQPLTQLTPANAGTVQPATFENTRTDAPRNVGGDIRLATFNVLNYFSTTGDSIDGCTYYNDRDGEATTVKGGCDARGAANADDLARQQAKIVSAINALDADVVSLEEIENSATFGKDRDDALSNLVAALNADAGDGVWAFVPSPAAVPASEDVIRTAFIYKPSAVETVGDSTILIGSAAFDNARQPLAQEFKLAGAADSEGFLVIVNHFKSKGSGVGPGNETDEGQGKSNADRVAQAEALVDFADEMKAASGTDRLFLSGDFNAYLMEDPIQVLTKAGYIDLGTRTGEETYAYDGMIGSLDHVFASPAAEEAVNDVDVWNINSVESVALEYSRYNNNVTDFYVDDMYRSSDHDPMVVGLNLAVDPNATVDLNLLNINDFHGRIDGNTVKFAGTIEQLRAAGGDANTLLGSAGDNIGASLFASSSQQDVPTIEVLNALGLESSVGNHEFDTGYPDLTGRIADLTDWDYLGANVYFKGTTDPALPEYSIFDVAGVDVGVIGAVTQETPSLVSQSGISMLDFGDPVDAVNRVAAQLTDGDPNNGEADVIVAEYHEGASQGTPNGATLESQVAMGGAFAKIVNETSAAVDAIFTAHTHKAYAWAGPIPGADGQTRPILQTGSYGENVGQVVLTYQPSTDAVVSYTERNVPRTTTADADLVAAYPRVAEVKKIVDDALKAAAVIGEQKVGSVTADITTAFGGTPPVRDDRGSESTLGNLVADALVSSLSDPELGGAEIGVVNPGGLRSELLYGDDGVITYAEANSVLPFLNNLWTTTLTGAQFKTVLEQQWQRDKDGNPITSGRTFLNLGLSNNVSYTYDPDATLNNHITSITVNGAPIDMAKDYRIGSFSFLLDGGDNFWEFKNGTDTRDSGLVDRDAWIDYIGANSPLSPSFARRGVAVDGYPVGAVAPGQSVTLTVSKLDLTSLGSPANTELSMSWSGTDLGTVPVVNGTATVTFTVPADAAATGELVLTAKESGTTVHLPFTVTAPTNTCDPLGNGHGQGKAKGHDKVNPGKGKAKGHDQCAAAGVGI
ncbi:ExeM/NucH family extracellular endonuclease [Cryobacterium tepidiphilum]|uniref:ExeM/NucH family extracellular endonuclease n=2 Tax=Cryobacterium tepidiphilum TaxID=2486026 RepID=A0A3M8LPY4_9MICO|nr:ExeM/NucH family extracellular endonuclease [Cryobacterium tepidiphilum]